MTLWRSVETPYQPHRPPYLEDTTDPNRYTNPNRHSNGILLIWAGADGAAGAVFLQTALWPHELLPTTVNSCTHAQKQTLSPDDLGR